ncbi:MAG: hypothetical protein QOE70_4775, partial [Chthoniobacter sp.]|nr:hypothetical protein [Chthoniobacter sp.]
PSPRGPRPKTSRATLPSLATRRPSSAARAAVSAGLCAAPRPPPRRNQMAGPTAFHRTRLCRPNPRSQDARHTPCSRPFRPAVDRRTPRPGRCRNAPRTLATPPRKTSQTVTHVLAPCLSPAGPGQPGRLPHFMAGETPAPLIGGRARYAFVVPHRRCRKRSHGENRILSATSPIRTITIITAMT